MKSQYISTLALGLLLAGCNMAPHYVRPDLPVAPTPPGGVGQDGAQGDAAKISTAPPVAWKTFFTDDRIRQLIDLSLQNNRDLRIAMANVAQARAQYRIQSADLFPTIKAGGSATYQRSPAGLAGIAGGGAGSGAGAGGTAAGGSRNRFDIYQAQVGVSAWEIDLFGRVRNLSTAAQEQYFASAENREAAQVTLVAEVATAWLTLGADMERLRIARETAQTYGQTLDITRARSENGVGSDLQIQQAQTTYEQARSDIALLTTTIAQDRNALDLLAGTHVPDALLPTGQDLDTATISQLPGGLASTVLLNRPDVAAAEHQLKAAYANIGAARAAFFPNISLTAAFGTLSLGLSNLFGNGSQNWSVAPSVSVPIFDAGRNLGNLRYAKATQDAMIATYEKTIQTAFREVADALARRDTIDEQLDAERRKTSAARGAWKISEARYKEGVDQFLTTLDSERSYYSAQNDLVSTRLTRQTNAVELYRALGGGLQADPVADAVPAGSEASTGS